MDNKEKLMKEALKEAKKAYEKLEVPVGAVIVKDEKIISKAYNTIEKEQNPIKHAEIKAIEKESDRKIEDIDVITIDMGCKVNGYCSDMTRTIFVGEVLDYVKPVYDLVLKNQEQVLRDLRENSNTKLIAKMVDNDFKLNNYGRI